MSTIVWRVAGHRFDGPRNPVEAAALTAILAKLSRKFHDIVTS